jgi:hypothetical protein
MGVENSIGFGTKIIDKVIAVTPLSISDIPSDDDDGKGVLEIFQPREGNCLIIRPHDLTGKVNVHPLVIYSVPEDDPNFSVYSELQNMIGGLFYTDGYETPGLLEQTEGEGSTEVSAISIKSMEDSGHEITDASTMDIGVAKNGDVTLILRSNGRSEEQKLSYLFKTAENGGRLPRLATVFTRIAQKTAAATSPFSIP